MQIISAAVFDIQWIKSKIYISYALTQNVFESTRLTVTFLFSFFPQEGWPMAVGDLSLQLQERRLSTAAPPAQAPPSFHPAASCSHPHGYATACRT